MDIVNLNNQIKIYSENQQGVRLEQLPFEAIRYILNNSTLLAFTIEYANQRYHVNIKSIEVFTFYIDGGKYETINFKTHLELKNTLNKCKLNILSAEFNSALNRLVYPFFNN